MVSTYETFRALHNTDTLFVLPNAWDAESAAILQQCNYPAIGTSSKAVAATLGYPDGEAMPFPEYLMLIQRIAACVSIPITIDMEMGYGQTKEAIYANLQKLLDSGVAGINIEDSVILDGKRLLKDPQEFAGTLTFIKNTLEASRHSLFVNVRCDTYLLNVKDKETQTDERARLYESAGADGIFLPLMSHENDISRVIAHTRLPLNLMAIPGLPALTRLEQLGVRRVSMGPFFQKKTYSKAKEIAKKVLEQKSLKPIL
jgi:2-methylisocitrate lyase-like PEP mutase family enzyme